MKPPLIAVTAGIIGIAIGMVVEARVFPAPEVVDAGVVQNLRLVTFSNGVTKILYHDYDYSSMAPGWDISTTVSNPITPSDNGDNERQLPRLVTPRFTFQGSNWQREVYTFSRSWGDSCQKSILYINRDAKSAETFHQFDVPYCITQTLDPRDVTTFFGMSEDQKTVAIGHYEDGSIIATAALPSPLQVRDVAANWENTKLLFAAGECSPDGDTMQLLLWDVSAGTLTDKRAGLPFRDCSGLASTYISYNHDKDAFDVFDSGRGDLPYLFSVK